MSSSNSDESFKSLAAASQVFEFFWKSQSCFSQWYLSDFKEHDITFCCAEQYMMYQKAVCFKDDEVAKQILQSSSPREMKKLGRAVKNYDDDIWEEKCYGVVKRANILKFSQNSELKQTLFDTKGKTLVEASPMDRKWGIGLTSKNPKAWNKSTWRGRNLLGYAITEARDELMQEEDVSD